MAIPENKVRVTITIEKDLRSKIEEYAAEDSRKIGQQIEFVLKKYVKERESTESK